MKNKAAIEKLTASAASTIFPKTEPSFVTFCESIKKLIRENFGCASHAAAWDPYEQDFFWEETETVRVDGLTVRVAVTRTFHIDPRKPLAEEFARVENERFEYVKEKAEVSRALYRMVIKREKAEV